MTKQQYFDAEQLATVLMFFPIITLILAVVAGFMFPAAADIYAGVIARSFIAMFVSAPLGYGISLYCESRAEEATE